MSRAKAQVDSQARPRNDCAPSGLRRFLTFGLRNKVKGPACSSLQIPPNKRAMARETGYFNCYAVFQEPSLLRTGVPRSARSLTTSSGETDHAEPGDDMKARLDGSGLKEIKAGLEIRRRCVLKSRGSAPLRPLLSPRSAASLRYLAAASISALRPKHRTHLGSSEVLFRPR